MGMMRRGKRFDYEHEKTVSGYTMTTVGMIKNASVIYADRLIEAPVKLCKKLRGEDSGLRTPLVRNGYYIHALPNGGECNGSAVD